MADNDDVQQPEGIEPPAGDASPDAKGDATQEPTALSAAELAQLRREAAQARASQARADKLQKDLERYTAAERQAQLDAAGEDGKLQVELKQAKERAEAAERKALLAERKATYPLAAKVLGDDIAVLTEERIAALQASLKEEDEGNEPPTPRGNNAARRDGIPQGGSEPKTDTVADHLARLRSMPLPPEWGGQG